MWFHVKSKDLLQGIVTLWLDLYLIITQKLTFMKSGGFHEIWQISPWNLVDFTHEIWQISPWNLVDFTMKSMKSSGFHHEIQQISWNPWNLVDFTMKSGGFHEIRQISGEIRCFRNQMQMFQQKLFWFYKVWGGFHLKSARFHLKSARFHEIHQILYRFHEIWWISWNPPDFMWNRKTFARNCNSMFISFNISQHLGIGKWNDQIQLIFCSLRICQLLHIANVHFNLQNSHSRYGPLFHHCKSPTAQTICYTCYFKANKWYLVISASISFFLYCRRLFIKTILRSQKTASTFDKLGNMPLRILNMIFNTQEIVPSQQSSKIDLVCNMHHVFLLKNEVLVGKNLNVKTTYIIGCGMFFLLLPILVYLYDVFTS